MALSVKKGTWTGNNTTSQGITGVGFQPKALIVWGSSSGATDVITANAEIGIGMGTRRGGSTQQLSVAHFYADNVATSDSGAASRAALLTSMSNASTVDNQVFLSSFDSDGFSVTYSVGTTDIFHYLAIGGADLTDANVIEGTMPTSGATFDVTGFGFQPDALFVITPGVASGSSSTGFTVGWGAVDTSGNECSCAVTASDADTMTSTMNNNGYFSASAISLLTFNADTVDALADWNSWLSDGVRFNLSNAPTASESIFLLGLKGGTYVVSNEAKQTTSGAESFTTTGITPKAVLLFAADGVTALDTVTVATAGVLIGGATATDGTQEGSATTVVAEAINTQGDRQHSTTKSIAFLTAGATSTLQTAADMTAFAANSFELTWSAAGTAERVGFLAMADAPVGFDPATIAEVMFLDEQ
jgi:hypothetical protein